MYSHKRSAWVRMNGLGVMIGLLEVFISLFFLIDPTHPSVVSLVAHAGMGFAGLGLLHAYLTRSVIKEMIALILVVVSNLLDFGVEALTRTPPNFDIRSATIQVIVVIGVGLRISGLLEGGTYIVPRWNRLERREEDRRQ